MFMRRKTFKKEDIYNNFEVLYLDQNEYIF